MRVLLVTPYDLAVPGGVNRHARGLLEALTARGIAARLTGPTSAPLAADSRVHTLGRVWTHPFNGARTHTTLDVWRVLPGVRRMLRDFDPTVINVQEPVAPLPCAAALWLARRDVRRVGTFHTFSETSRGYLWTWPWVRTVWSSLDARVAVAPAAREFATRYHRAAFTVIPHGIAAPAPSGRPPPSGRALRVLFVGRMDEPRKGFGTLLAALRRIQISSSADALTLTAVGRGAELWRAAAAGLPVDFAGELTDAQLEARYAAADLVAVPSLGGESFGLVALEALARGVPVLASRIAGHEPWLADVAALAPPGDAVVWAEALRALAKNPARRATLAAAGAARAHEHCWDAIVDRWLAVYAAKAGGSP